MKHGGVCTVGKVTTEPGIVTAVVGSATMTLDQRHLDAAVLKQMYDEAVAASERIAAEEKIEVQWTKLWQIQPFPFNPELIDMADAAIKEVSGVSHRLPSGPLHDAAEVCRTGIPTVMLFVQSLRGISHNKIEDTREDHLEISVRALDKLATETMAWIQKKRGLELAKHAKEPPSKKEMQKLTTEMQRRQRKLRLRFSIPESFNGS